MVYAILLLAVGLIAGITTFEYEYMPDPNTRFEGWPIPTVIFQRDTPDGPWLDYIGPTIILAYPINFILFMTPPSIVVLIVIWARRPNAVT